MLLILAMLSCYRENVLDGPCTKCLLDEDGDGVTKGERDCNDEDSERFPGNPEIPYDGIDQDCDELHSDLLDVDGDWWPAIDRATYDEMFPDGAGWPAVTWESPADCDDEDDEINPRAVDIVGDGVDQDCDPSTRP